MLLAGEPGIGKTTLAARFASEVSEAGATVVYGRCDEDLGIPYQPWIEALTQLVAHVPERVLVEHVAERGAHLARLVPELVRRVAMEVPTATGGRDTGAVRALRVCGRSAGAVGPGVPGAGGARRPALGGPAERAAAAPRHRRGALDAGGGAGHVPGLGGDRR